MTLLCLLNQEHNISLQYLDDFKYILSHTFLSIIGHVPLVLYISCLMSSSQQAEKQVMG